MKFTSFKRNGRVGVGMVTSDDKYIVEITLNTLLKWAGPSRYQNILSFFSKTPTSVIGHLDEIDSHSGVVKELDYEVELAVIIGRAGKSIKKEEADDYIFGYAVFGDTTARDLQRRHVQYLLEKSGLVKPDGAAYSS